MFNGLVSESQVRFLRDDSGIFFRCLFEVQDERSLSIYCVSWSDEGRVDGLKVKLSHLWTLLRVSLRKWDKSFHTCFNFKRIFAIQRQVSVRFRPFPEQYEPSYNELSLV